jgi:hypothetical protein
MPVNSSHYLYDDYVHRWKRCRDAYEGGDAVKRMSTLYLPLLEGHTSSAATGYVGYLNRALFYPATGRTVAGLTGLVFAKPPTATNVPALRREEFNDVTLNGTPLASFGMQLCHEALVTGRAGVLIDMPPVIAPGQRPYWVLYRAEQITNWRVQRINGKQTLTMVVLREVVEAQGDDQFDLHQVTQYRVLELTGGVYTVTLWREKKNDKNEVEWVSGVTLTPQRRGQPLPFIPFYFFTPTGLESDVVPPPLLPLVDVNLSHYRTSADHEHGAHFTALPTPYVTGHTVKDGETLAIGSGTAWILPNPAAACGMLEFTGAGLASLKELKEEKRQLMVTLGARMLETQPSTQEAYATVRLRHSGESSALSVLAEALGQALTQSVKWHLWWEGYELAALVSLQISMNPEIMDELSAEDIRVLVETWQKKGISKKTLFYNLQWGEWTRPGVTFEEEEQEIENEKPDDPPVPPALVVPPQPQPGAAA